MARIRTIKPDFWTDEKIVELTPFARLLFIGLWNFADDSGRMVYSPKKIKMQIFPADSIDISELLGELRRNSLVIVYNVENIEYLQIKNFDSHQKIDKRSASKLPNPPESPRIPAESPRIPTTEGKGMEVEGIEPEKSGGRKNKTTLPAGFTASDAVLAWAEGKGIQNLERHVEHFITTCQAKGYKYVDWDAALRNAITNDWARIGNGGRKFEL